MNKDSICVSTICRNEIDILPYTLAQSIKWADKIIMLDGGPESSSDDGTFEYLQKIQQQYPNKIHLETGTFGSDHSMKKNWDKLVRQRYMDILSEWDWPGFNLLIDSDEVYSDLDWQNIKKYVKIANENNQILIRYPYINFFYDLKHVVHDTNFDTLCHHLTKYEQGQMYLDQSTLLRDSCGKILCHYPDNRIICTDEIKLWHYGHAAPYEKQRLRNWRYRIRGDLGQEIAKSMPPRPEEWNWVDPRIEELKNTNRVKLFEGKHPECMSEYVRNYNAKSTI